MKDTEVTCRFKESLLREGIYKEITKTKWPLTRIVGMVLRPEGLVDFTLKTKDLALSFAKALNDLESIRTATAMPTPWSRSELTSSPQASLQNPLPIT